MRNPLRRIVERRPPREAGFAVAPPLRREIAPGSQLPADDYLVEGATEPETPSAALRVVHGLQVVLVIVLAALSFAVFWLVGTILNLF